MENNSVYRGRFAPTPSGPLHFGSLTTAVGSYLQAKRNNGEWLLRIEDIDPPRVVAGATDKILHCLEKYGLYWDGPVLYQSTRNKLFQQAVDALIEKGLVYACKCSRKDIAAANAGKANPAIYPGTCRLSGLTFEHAHSLRVLTKDSHIEFDDVFCGKQSQDVETEVGDFVIKRVDGYYAYHLAVVVDDEEQKISEVIRGHDLIDSTFRQIYLQKILKFNTPVYGHLPLIVDATGSKLSKQDTHDLPLLDYEPVPVLIKAMHYLGHEVPAELADTDIDSFWQWAIQNWQPDKVPEQNSLIYHTEN